MKKYLLFLWCVLCILTMVGCQGISRDEYEALASEKAELERENERLSSENTKKQELETENGNLKREKRELTEERDDLAIENQELWKEIRTLRRDNEKLEEESEDQAPMATPKPTPQAPMVTPKPTPQESKEDQEYSNGKPTVSLEEFEALTMGISYSRACEIIGSEGELQAQSNGVDVYAWEGQEPYSLVNLTFINGRLNSKAQAGLEG